MKKGDNGLFVFDDDDLDPAIAATIETGRRRQADRERSPAQRRKAKTDAARTKTTYDLDPAIADQIDQVAKILSIPASQVAAVLLIAGLQGINDGWVKFDYPRHWSRSPRFQFVIDIPDTPTIDLEILDKPP